MKKHFFKIFISFLLIFIVSPLYVSANEGDLRYEITKVDITDSTITFKGWAFIHRTNNYTTVKLLDGSVVKNGGDQKIMMRAVTPNGEEIKTKVAIGGKNKNGSTGDNYNFYCDLFHNFGDGTKCTADSYASSVINTCANDDNGNTESGQCYYEDIYFEIEFDVSSWNYNEVKFLIAASNSDFETRKTYTGNLYDGDYYTRFENVSVGNYAVTNKSSRFIKIDESSISNKVEFIADHSILHNKEDRKIFKYNDISSSVYTYGAWIDNSVISQTCKNKYYLDLSYNNTGKLVTNDNKKDFLGYNIGTTYYYIMIKQHGAFEGLGLSGSVLACPATLSEDFLTVLATGSHVKISGDNIFRITIEKKNFCEVDDPYDINDKLTCNSSKTLNSECERLTVVTSEGSADVTIKQTGYISNILTPNKTYAGGGFSFGIMYTNTIKWDYADNSATGNLHNAIVSEMNGKLKSDEEFARELNITNLTFGGKIIDSSFLVKKCTSSGNFYKDSLTTICTFYIPDSDIGYDGNVSYSSGSGSSVSNKYYTPLNYNGRYDITATITGMSRITDNAAKSDSATKGNAWTGDWTDTFENCSITLYPLIYQQIDFIYRPIDIKDPFPNRNAGINWYEWYSVENNKEYLENTYNYLQYQVELDSGIFSRIKSYNSTRNYLSWDSINKNTEMSSFVTEYVTRVGGN